MKLVASVALFGMLLAACGSDDGSHVHDAFFGDGPAGSGDAPPDSPPAPPQPVSITITNGGAAGSGLTVYFQNADSTLVTEATTDGSGNASTVMAGGGYVTALVPNPHVERPANTGSNGFQDVTLDTFAGVQPGDHLVIDVAAPVGLTTVSLTARSIVGAAELAYTAFTTCDPIGDGEDLGTLLGSGATGTVFVSNGCATADLAVYAQGPGSAAPVIAAQAGVAIAASVDLTSVAYAAAAQVAVSYSDIPAGVDGVSASRVELAPHGQLASPTATPAITAGAATATLYEPSAITATGAVTFTSATFAGATFGDQQVIEAGAAGATYALDVGANLVHEYTAKPTYAAATHAVTWTEDATGVAADAHLVGIEVARAPNDWTWRMVAAHNATTLTYPTLPTDVFDYNGGATDTVTVNSLEALKVPGGYDAARAHLFSTLSASALAGAAGKVTVETLQGPLPALKQR